MIQLRNLLPLMTALAVLCSCASAQSSDFPTSAPPDAPATKVKPGVILRKTLPNGLRVVIQESHRIPAVQIKMGIRAGQVSDPVDNPMMAEFALGAIQIGSVKYTAEKREKAANGMGGDLSIVMSQDYVNVSASCLSTYFGKMMDLTADMIMNPKLDPEMLQSATDYMAYNVKHRRYPPPEDESKGRQAYLSRYPTADTVNRLDRDHLIEFLENYYCPNNSLLIICGDVDAPAAMRQVAAAFKEWKPGQTPPLPSFVKEVIHPFYFIYLHDAPTDVESRIQFSIDVPGLEDKDRIALQLANIITGETLDSRLFRSVREKYGYVYSINSGVDFNAYATRFWVGTMCRSAVTAKTVKQIEAEITRMREEPVTAEELQEGKNTLNHKYDIAMQSQDAAVEQLFEVEFYKRPADYFSKLRARINGMTAADVQRVAKQYMFPNGSAYIQIVGPKEKIVDRLMNAKVGEIVNPDAD